MAFVPALVSVLLGRWLTHSAGFQSTTLATANASDSAVVAAILQSVLGVAASGFLTLVALDVLMGRRHGIGQYVGQSLRQIMPLVVLSALYSLAAGIGLVLLILPGLYIFARYQPLVAAIVFEDAGWSGLGRARDLTKGYRWPLVGLFLLIGLALGVVGGGMGMLLMLAGPLGGGAGFAFEVLMTTLYLAYAAIYGAVIYLRLRELNEGMTLDAVSATVD